MLLLILSIMVLLLIYTYFHHEYGYWSRLGVYHSKPSFPFGNMADVIFRRCNMGDKIRCVYNSAKATGHRYAGLYFFSRKAWMPVDPILVKHILAKDFHHFSDRGLHYDERGDPLSAHLFSLAGPRWRSLRARLTPAYSPGKLRYMFPTICSCGHQLVQVLGEETRVAGNVEIKEMLARYTTDVIGSCAFGLECNTLRYPEAEFREMGRRAFTQTVGDVIKVTVIRSFPSLAKWLGLGIFSSEVTDFFMRAVKETIEYREREDVTRRDFLQLLIQLKNKGKLDGDESTINECNEEKPRDALTMDEAAAQAFIFFLAGFETTSAAISFALYEMALNRGIQQRAREEVTKLYHQHNEDITFDCIAGMHYLEQVIQETLRKYPPAPVFLRKCTKDWKVPDSDLTIKEGMTVLVPTYGMHRDPEYFPEPEAFDPDRFSIENRSKIWDYTYIPFGDGPRACIGMRFSMIQTKIALALMLLNFEFKLSKKTLLPLELERKGIILAAVGGIWLDLKEIKLE